MDTSLNSLDEKPLAEVLSLFVKEANKKPDWEASDLTAARYMGEIDFQDEKGESHDFSLYTTWEHSKTPLRFVFGGHCNAGFLESGYLQFESDEYVTDILDDLMVDLHNYYNCGPKSVSRIIVNERM